LQTSSSAITETSRCRVIELVIAKSDRLELGDNIYGQYIGLGLYSTTTTYLASKEIEIGEKTQNKGYYAVQDHPSIEVGTNRKPVCDFQ